MWQTLLDTDRALLYAINGWHSEGLDALHLWLSERFVWVPLYILLALLLVRLYKRTSIVALLLVAPMITATDQLASAVLKPSVQRLRPCHDPLVAPHLHRIGNYCGGEYGFVSSHAANTVALAVYVWLLTVMQWRWLGPLLLGWAGLVSLSRVYLGVHYPSDVLCGGLLGAVIAYCTYTIWRRLQPKLGQWFGNK
jgi:undecaprenyl-diphosphatase